MIRLSHILSELQETYFLVWEPAPNFVWKIVARSRIALKRSVYTGQQRTVGLRQRQHRPNQRTSGVPAESLTQT